jgi:hypothetical protein
MQMVFSRPHKRVAALPQQFPIVIFILRAFLNSGGIEHPFDES